MLAWDITKAYLIPQTPTTSSGIIILWIPIMSCFSKRKITFPWCLLWRCSSKTKRSYYVISDPPRYWCTMDSLYSSAMNYLTFSCAFPFLQAVAPKQNEPQDLIEDLWKFREPVPLLECTEQSWLSSSFAVHRSCSSPAERTKEHWVTAVLIQRAICFSGACLCAK